MEDPSDDRSQGMGDPVGAEVGRMGAVHRAFIEIGTVKHAAVKIIDVIIPGSAHLVKNLLVDAVVKGTFLRGIT